MDRTASILRPWGASFVGVLVLLCMALPAEVAVAASSTPLLQPDAPPMGAVVAPAPDAPAAEAPQPAVGHGQPVLRPTLRVESVKAAPPAAKKRPKSAAAPTRVATTSRRASKHQRPVPASVLRRGRLPDGFDAFLSAPVARVADDGIDRGVLVLAGLLLAVVTLGGGCLTLAVGRVAQER